MKKKSKKILKILILIIVPLISFLFILTPFQKQILIKVNTTIIPEGDLNKTNIQYNYKYVSSDEITHTTGSRFITSKDITKPSMVKEIFNNLFNIPFGSDYNYLCFHNIQSRFSICMVPTDFDQRIIFTFNEEDINLSSGETICKKYSSNKEFYAIINNKMRYPGEETVADFMKKEGISSCPEIEGKYPYFFADVEGEIYVKPIFGLMVFKNLLLFLLWAGIILLVNEIYKFVKN